MTGAARRPRGKRSPSERGRWFFRVENKLAKVENKPAEVENKCPEVENKPA
ncbi:hypothetical protein [Bacillus sp. Marseille-Q1617]|uniref:hypothetical protein n=1 Tax=Bacillus sp. Marseille-Q1617 TaxID=2736887 RepID=UPI00158C4A0C|nr:hypothetical protein [Bacillus sp. Marseille-Q1617]